MSHVLNYAGHYFRVDVTEVATLDDPSKTVYVAWSSDAFKDLKDLPEHACSRFIDGPPHAKQADALRSACDWIKADWDAELARRPFQVGQSASRRLSVLYTVALFKGNHAFKFDFEEFSDAKAFARAAEKSLSMTKVGITNNESPQYLEVWEKGK